MTKGELVSAVAAYRAAHDAHYEASMTQRAGFDKTRLEELADAERAAAENLLAAARAESRETPLIGGIEALIAEARDMVRCIEDKLCSTGGACDSCVMIQRLADALALARGGGDEENSNGLDVASDRISLDDSFASPTSRVCDFLNERAAWFDYEASHGGDREYLKRREEECRWIEQAIRTGRYRVDGRPSWLVDAIPVGDAELSSTANVETRHDIPTQPVKIPPDTEHDGGEVFGRWLLIETAPKDFTEILVAHGGDVYTAIWEAHAQPPYWSFDAYDLGHGRNEIEPTHWMPLPPPPRTGGE